MRPIATLTPNPSLDLLFEADALVWDDANRVAPPRRRAGGQGINVVRAARALGGRGIAVAPLGGAVGASLAAMLGAEGTPLRAIPVAGDTRLFVGIRETGSGRSMLVNPRGPSLSPSEIEALTAEVDACLDEEGPAWLCGCGSIPPGPQATLYAEIGRRARARGVRFVPDCDGEPLRLAAEAGCDLLVPNEHEAARLLGAAIEDVTAAARAARTLLRYGPRLAAVTLGARGAVVATAREAWQARPPKLPAGSAVGAGDAFLAALLLMLEGDAAPPDALRAAVAAGSAVLLAKGAAMLDPAVAKELSSRVEVRRAG